jgi:ferritin-like metal-binding protein YciE
MKTLKDLFCVELADAYDAEQRIAHGLPEMAKAATCPSLSAMFESHLKETERHIVKLEQVIRSLDGKIGTGKCEAVMALLKESHDLTDCFEDSPAINAALIAAAQKLGHYKIAFYGCLREWAGLLECNDVAVVMDEILEQEKTADEAFTDLARSGRNEEACGNGSDVEAFEVINAARYFQPVGRSAQ